MTDNKHAHPNVQRRLDKEFAKSLKAIEDSIVAAKEAYGDSHPQLADCFCQLGQLYQSHSGFDEAEDAYIKALVIRDKHLDDSSALVNTLRMLGRLYELLGNSDEARSLMQRATKTESEAFAADISVAEPVEFEVDAHAEFVDEMAGSAPKTFWTQTFGGLIFPFFISLIGIKALVAGEIAIRSRNSLEALIVRGPAAYMLGVVWLCGALFTHFHFFWPYRNIKLCSYGKAISLVVGVVLLFAALTKMWIQ